MTLIMHRDNYKQQQIKEIIVMFNTDVKFKSKSNILP